MRDSPDLPQVHRVSSGLTSNPWVFFGGGLALVAVAAAGFAFSLRGPTNPLQLHLRSTLPMIFAVGLFMTGFRFARSPREVVIDHDAVQIHSGRSTRRLDWDQIAWADEQTQAISNRKLVAVYGNDGKVLVKLPSNIDRFEELVHAVKQRLADHPSPYAGAVRWRKSRRQAKMFFVGTLLALAGAAFMGWTIYDQRRTDHLLRTEAIDGEGVVVRKFVAPDGRTHRIEYRVAGAGDNAKLHNVEVDPALWVVLDPGARLPIITVPGHADIARLRAGEIEDEFLNPPPILNVLLFIGMSLMAILFLVAAILGFKGIDIGTDKATGKLKIERLPPLP